MGLKKYIHAKIQQRKMKKERELVIKEICLDCLTQGLNLINYPESKLGEFLEVNNLDFLQENGHK